MEYMADHEKKLATKLVEHLLETGHAVSVYDGEETTVSRSTDQAEILGAMATTDEDVLTVWSDGKRQGAISLVYGNEPGVLLSDYSVSLEPLLESVNAYAETLEE